MEQGPSDWRLLDACFTDERLDVAERSGSWNDMIVGVDDVNVEDVDPEINLSLRTLP